MLNLHKILGSKPFVLLASPSSAIMEACPRWRANLRMRPNSIPSFQEENGKNGPQCPDIRAHTEIRPPLSKSEKAHITLKIMKNQV